MNDPGSCNGLYAQVPAVTDRRAKRRRGEKTTTPPMPANLTIKVREQHQDLQLNSQHEVTSMDKGVDVGVGGGIGAAPIGIFGRIEQRKA